MLTYLQLVDVSNKHHSEARDALTLFIVHQALDESLWHKIATANTRNEALSILAPKYSKWGSDLIESLDILTREYNIIQFLHILT